MGVRCYKSTMDTDLTSLCVPVSLQENTTLLFAMCNLPNTFFVVLKVNVQDCDL